MKGAEIATLPAKHYITSLEVVDLAGNLATCELTLTPTGFSSTTPASFWTLLLRSLVRRDPIIAWEKDVDSLRGGRQQRLDF